MSDETKSKAENNPHETTVKITRDREAWEVLVEAEIPAEAYLRYRAETLKEMQKTAKLDGFRPGHAPEEAIIRVYGEPTIARHATEHAIQHELLIILAKENLPVVETPRVTTETPVAGKPVTFSARAALAPEIILPDYKKIAKKHTAIKEDADVSDKEHSDALLHLSRERARIEKMEAGMEPAKASEESRKMEAKDLPALDDAFTESLGYKNAEHFERQIRENMKAEKERQIMEKRRQNIIEEMVKESKISYPAILRDYELGDMEERFKEDLARAGTNFDAYLTETKKTREQLRIDWKGSADKRAKTRLILAEIARKENISPDEKKLTEEVEHARKHYKDANAEVLRAHIGHAMRNDAVLQFLEKSDPKE